MTSKENTINWFEISVQNLNRAKAFYESIFNIKMNTDTSNMMGMEMAFFPMEMGSGKISGCLCQSQSHKPSADGVKLYLNANPDLSVVLSKVAEYGGKVIMPKTKITDELGYMAFLVDTEGNSIALHSQK
jgi:predicted enzyme related to lactoylglutathione lyase